MFSLFGEQIGDPPTEPRALSTCPQRYLSVPGLFPIIGVATDRLREGLVEWCVPLRRMELGDRRAASGVWPQMLMPSLPLSRSSCFVWRHRPWTFVTGTSLLADARNYCQYWGNRGAFEIVVSTNPG